VETEEGGRKGGGREFERRFQRFLEREEVGVQREEGGRDFERRFWSLDSAVERERGRETMATTTTAI
jgi:hypothetical protein